MNEPPKHKKAKSPQAATPDPTHRHRNETSEEKYPVRQDQLQPHTHILPKHFSHLLPSIPVLKEKPQVMSWDKSQATPDLHSPP